MYVDFVVKIWAIFASAFLSPNSEWPTVNSERYTQRKQS